MFDKISNKCEAFTPLGAARMTRLIEGPALIEGLDQGCLFFGSFLWAGKEMNIIIKKGRTKSGLFTI